MKLGLKKIALLAALLMTLTAIQIACDEQDADDCNDDDDDDNDTDANGDAATHVPNGHNLDADCYGCHENAHNGDPVAPTECLACHPH
jgi:hypothetical protein